MNLAKVLSIFVIALCIISINLQTTQATIQLNKLIVMEKSEDSKGMSSELVGTLQESEEAAQTGYDCRNLEIYHEMKLYNNIEQDYGVISFPFTLYPPEGVSSVVYTDTIWTYVIVDDVGHKVDSNDDGWWDYTKVDLNYKLYVVSSEDSIIIHQGHVTGSSGKVLFGVQWRQRFPWIATHCPCEGDSLKFFLRVLDNLQPQTCSIYPNEIEKYSESFAVIPKPVVTVHGWNGGVNTWGNLKSILDTTCYDVRHFVYNSQWLSDWNIDIGSLASQLGQFISSLESELNISERKVNLIAHSMGGLISRRYIADNSNNHNVDKLVLIATPNYGAAAAAWSGLLPSSLQAKQMRFGSKFLWNLHEDWINTSYGVNVLCIAGAKDGYSKDHDGTVLLTSASMKNLETPYVHYPICYVPLSHGGDIAFIDDEDHPSLRAMKTFFEQRIPESNEGAVSQHTEGLIVAALFDQNDNFIQVNTSWLHFPDVYWSPKPSFDWPWPGVGHGVNIDNGQGIYYASGIESGSYSYQLTIYPKGPYRAITNYISVKPRETTVRKYYVEAANEYLAVSVDPGVASPITFGATGVTVQLTSWPGGELSVKRVDEAPPQAGFSTVAGYWMIQEEIPDSSYFHANVTIEYNESELRTAGIEESKLGVANYTNMWRFLPSSKDTLSNKITYQTDKFSGLLSLADLGVAEDSIITIEIDMPQLTGDYSGFRSAEFYLPMPFDSIISAKAIMSGFGGEWCIYYDPFIPPICEYNGFAAYLDDQNGEFAGWWTQTPPGNFGCESDFYEFYAYEGDANWSFLSDGWGSLRLWGAGESPAYLNSVKLRFSLRPLNPSFQIFAPVAQMGIPGESCSYDFIIVNRGKRSDYYNISVQRMLYDWPCFYPTEVGPVAPNDTAHVRVLVQTPEDYTEPTRHYLTLKACSQGAPLVCQEAATHIAVPTAIASYDVKYIEGYVKLIWELSEEVSPQELSVYRKDDKGTLIRLPGNIELKEGKYCFYDHEVSSGATYEYKMGFGNGDILLTLASIEIPTLAFHLYQNVPNPFNPETVIKYAIPEKSIVELKIYDVQGALVRSLVSGKKLEPRIYESTWDGRDDHGNPVSSGIYFYRLKAGKHISTMKMVLIK